MIKFLYLGIGTLAGGFARYFLTGAMTKITGTEFPFGTLTVNLLGCFIIGLLSAIVDEKFFLGPDGRLMLMTGFCGAFTTFSAFMLETGTLANDGQLFRACLYVIVSVIAGFMAYRLGVGLAQLI